MTHDAHAQNRADDLRDSYVAWTNQGPDPDPGDDDLSHAEAAMAEVMQKFLAGVSFESGNRPDYSPLPSLFAEGGRLVRTSSGVPESLGIEEFVKNRTDDFLSGRLTSFSETETAQVTERFGNVAHRLSTYSKRSERAGVVTRSDGIISTQFIGTPTGWRISAMAWDDERPGLTIPSRYR